MVVKLLCIVFVRSWRTGEVPEDWRKASVTPVSRKEQERGAGKLQASQPHLLPWEGDAEAYSGCLLQASGFQESSV